MIHLRDSVLQMRYANNSNYKNDVMIRKEVHVTKSVIAELRRIVEDSDVSTFKNLTCMLS